MFSIRKLNFLSILSDKKWPSTNIHDFFFNNQFTIVFKISQTLLTNQSTRTSYIFRWGTFDFSRHFVDLFFDSFVRERSESLSKGSICSSSSLVQHHYQSTDRQGRVIRFIMKTIFIIIIFQLNEIILLKSIQEISILTFQILSIYKLKNNTILSKLTFKWEWFCENFWLSCK